jgi:hypothetical protein
MLPADSIVRAEEHEASFLDVRARHFWDDSHEAGRLFANSLHLNAAIAWDIYLLYSPGRRWLADQPPEPIFWMHQLEEEPSLLLDARRFSENVQALVDKL